MHSFGISNLMSCLLLAVERSRDLYAKLKQLFHKISSINKFLVLHKILKKRKKKKDNLSDV